jgi:hypothetical protein
VLTPDPAREALQIELRGNLAAMLGATVQSKRSPESDDLSLQVSLVAGVCSQLNVEFSWGRRLTERRSTEIRRQASVGMLAWALSNRLVAAATRPYFLNVQVPL